MANNERFGLSVDVERVCQQLFTNEHVQRGLKFLEHDNDFTTREQIELTEIPAPTFAEETRGNVYRGKLVELGLEDVHIDKAGNVFGMRRGSGNGPNLVVCAHLDTVFPNDTDVKAKIIDGKICAPGIADDGRGLATVLTLVRAFHAAKIKTVGTIIFGATVGEEGLGDLRGVKALFQNRKDIDGFISIEPGDAERITYLATGSRRYQVQFSGAGGHSYGDFGTPSPIHALGRAISEIAKIETPKQPKTTFNVGIIKGGTSVNTIAEAAEMVIDMRSSSQKELLKLEEKVLSIIKKAAKEENGRSSQKHQAISIVTKLVGDRPAGFQDPESIIVQTSAASASILGFQPILEAPSSTDSNIPISLGIPAVTLGGGGAFGGCHTLHEFYDPTDAFYGVQKIFLTILGLVGVANISKPLLNKNGVEKVNDNDGKEYLNPLLNESCIE